MKFVFIVVSAGTILSLFFDSQVIQGVIAVTGILTIIIQRRWRRNDQAIREQEDKSKDTSNLLEVEHQTRPAPLGGKSGDDTSDPSSDDDNTSEPLNRSGLLRTDDELLDEVGTKLGDRVEFNEDRTIKLIVDDLNVYSQMMVYLIAKRLAYEDQIVDTPSITGRELRDRFGYTKVDLMLFLDEAQTWVTPSYGVRSPGGTIEYASLDITEFTVDIRNLSATMEWTLDEQQSTRRNLSVEISAALGVLYEARKHYEEAQDSKAADEYSHPKKKYAFIGNRIQTACKDVQQYPVQVGYDGSWKTFSRYAEALLDYLDDGVPSKTTHCVPRMERALEHMKEEAGAI